MSSNPFGDDSDNSIDLFGGINAADIADDPYDVPDDTYEVACKEAKIGKTKGNPEKNIAPKFGLTLNWLITGGNDAIIGRQVSEWFQVGPFENAPGTKEYDTEVTRRSFLKRRLTSMGVPESKMGGSFDPTDLIGVTGVMKTKKKDENVRVTSFVLKDTEGSGSIFG